MAGKPDTHKLQPDPPEGDRKTIERELARQEGKDPDSVEAGDDETDGKDSRTKDRRPG